MDSVFNQVNPALVDELKVLCGDDYVFTQSDILAEYGHDETEDLIFLPEVLVKPANTEQISAVMKLANKNLIPVTPIGGKTGLSGGALPVYGGISLSLERLNRIIEIDTNRREYILALSEIYKDKNFEFYTSYPRNFQEISNLETIFEQEKESFKKLYKTHQQFKKKKSSQ